MGEYRQGDLEKLNFLFLPIFHQKRKGCFSKQTKVKNTFSQTSRKIKKWMLKEQLLRFFLKPRGNSENNFGDVGKIFLVEKNSFFERTRLENATKKKDETKKEKKNWRGFTERDAKREWWRRLKRDMKFLQRWKGEKVFFFFEKKCLATKKKESDNEEGGPREREHQEGTYKGVKTWKESTDRKRNEKHKKKWGRSKWKFEQGGFFFVSKEYQKWD